MWNALPKNEVLVSQLRDRGGVRVGLLEYHKASAVNTPAIRRRGVPAISPIELVMSGAPPFVEVTANRGAAVGGVRGMGISRVDEEIGQYSAALFYPICGVIPKIVYFCATLRAHELRVRIQHFQFGAQLRDQPCAVGVWGRQLRTRLFVHG